MSQPNRPTGQDFLMGVAGPPSISWKGATPGTSIRGVVVAPPEVVQQSDPDTRELLFWDGDPSRPKWQGVVTLATEFRDPTNPEDEGERRLFYKGKLRDAIRDACAAVKAPGLEIGAEIIVTLTGRERVQGSLTSERNLYAVQLKRPTGGDFLGVPAAQPAAQAAPAAQAPPAQLPVAQSAPDTSQAPPGVDPGVYASQPPAVQAAMWNVANGGLAQTG